jgi:hypothetical protein
MRDGHTVLLRNGQFAEVTANVEAAGFTIQGRTRDGSIQLWRTSGHWRSTDDKHPLDIVAVVFPDGHALDITAGQKGGK